MFFVHVVIYACCALSLPVSVSLLATCARIYVKSEKAKEKKEKLNKANEKNACGACKISRRPAAKSTSASASAALLS